MSLATSLEESPEMLAMAAWIAVFAASEEASASIREGWTRLAW